MFRLCCAASLRCSRSHLRAAFHPSRFAASRRRVSESLNKDDWVEVSDPQGSGKTYWWNRATNQTTHVGAARPGSAAAALERVKSFKDEVARSIHAQRRGRFIVGDGGYYYTGGGGDGGASGGA
eukprot:TRINITY_DN24134_c0_g1_i1.p2 TRINITY_DN24134_c0_g1~~TRINITY_DN24134_c0_g1_i1.p2  ORF type:complete len:124 (-),score=25.09 TRINITY_DN24134_c0_g1_i1:101-472(-)